MPKLYLVTGGTGFIGSSSGQAIVGSRLPCPGSRQQFTRLIAAPGGLSRPDRLATGDIRDAGFVGDAAKGADAICHLAYLNGTRYFYQRPDDVLEIGVKGMVNVLDACARHGIEELILASSSEVYQTPPDVPTDETAPLVVPDVMNPRFLWRRQDH